MINSIEMNWLSRHDKQLSLPNLCFHELEDYGGEYFSPTKERIFVGNKDFDCTNGLIVISTCFSEIPNHIASTMAHEWRHHWQRHNGWLMGYKAGFNYDFSENQYESEIIRYFTENAHENDALRFQIKTADCEMGKEWMSWVNA